MAAVPVVAQQTTTTDTLDSASAAAQVTVTEKSIDPQVLMRGDRATMTVTITNNGGVSVPISRAFLSDASLSIPVDSYDSVGSIGAGNSMTFTFTVRADVPDGVYYPRFSINYRSAPSLRDYIPVKVESTELDVSLVKRPDTFSAGNRETIELRVGNPRENTINGISVVPMGEGVEVEQSGYFIGKLEPDESANVSFDITPQETGTLTFHVTYRNGFNTHVLDHTLPIVISEDKRAARPVVSNIVMTTSGGVYTLSGDITNAGLKVANSVIITTGAPATPVEPNRIYVVGSLDPDDFSSFEVNFRADDADSVPLLIQYKDEDGNSYERETPVSINRTPSSEEEREFPIAIVALLIVAAVVVAGIIVYSWKKKA
ncbi:MAG: hypothetical protein QCH35_02815 [Methanomicrobiaceae archaeon]|nr:hypothetical protein [Methanomicrobiaceae archaeon]